MALGYDEQKKITDLSTDFCMCAALLYIFSDSFSQLTLPKSGITYASQFLHPHAQCEA